MDLSTSSLFTALTIIPDPRKDKNIRHDLKELLVIAICAVASGADGFEDIELFGKSRESWFKTFLKLENGVPSHDTFNRIFRILDKQALEDFFTTWTQSVAQVFKGEVVAIDAKKLRRSFDRNGSPLYLLTAWATENGVVLGQMDVNGAEAECASKLVKKLFLKGCIVTADAASCRKEFCKAVMEKKADYVLSLKANEPKLYAHVSTVFENLVEKDGIPAPVKSYTTEESGHGRYEKREYFMTEEISSFPMMQEWPGLKSIGMVISSRQSGGSFPTVEVRYFISSLKASAINLERAVRGHWQVENKAHWTLDTTFREDESRVRKDNAASNLAALRRLSLNLIKQNQDKGSVRGKVKKCGWDTGFLLKVLAG